MVAAQSGARTLDYDPTMIEVKRNLTGRATRTSGGISAPAVVPAGRLLIHSHRLGNLGRAGPAAFE